jgi:hypothetical protein
MRKRDFITQEETEFPIGDSGLFFKKDFLFENLSVNSIKHISGSLYEIMFWGLKPIEHDVISTVSKSVWNMCILDINDGQLHAGYAQKLNENLYAIFDLSSIDVGWPAHDVIIIKNIINNRKYEIIFEAPAEEKFVVEKNLFIFQGCLGNIIDQKWEDERRWRIFINKDGKVIYKGFCWEYQFSENTLIIKKDISSSRKTKRIVA